MAEGKPVEAPPSPLPRPQYLSAEPTPNDDGTHITVRWPRVRTEEEDFEYVLYVSLDPRWRQFECQRLRPDSGFITDRDIAGFYPYHVHTGHEHLAVVKPPERMRIAWLHRERQFAEWVENALGCLVEEQHVLLTIRKLAKEQRSFRKRSQRYRAGWEKQIGTRRNDYLRRFGVPELGSEFDISALRAALNQKRQALKEDKNKKDGSKKSEGKLLKRKLKALRGIEKLIMYVEQSRARQQNLANQLQAARARALDPLAEFSSFYELVEAQARHTIADWAWGGTDPGELTHDLLTGSMERLEQEAEKARLKTLADEASPEDFAHFDRLRYVRLMARYFSDRLDRQVERRPIEDALLHQLSTVLADADLPPMVSKEDAPHPDTAALRGALKLYRAAERAYERDGSQQAADAWRKAQESFRDALTRWREAQSTVLRKRFSSLDFTQPREPLLEREISRLSSILNIANERLKKIERSHAGRTYYFRLAVASGDQVEMLEHVAWAAASPAVFDAANSTPLAITVLFTCAVLGMLAYVRRNPNVFIRKINGLDAIDEAIGRATEMGKPALFVHGLTGVSDIAVIASVNILSRIAKQIATYETDLLVVNNDPIVYSVSYEVVREGYVEAGRPDAFKGDNIFMAASRQFPYVAAVAGIMARRNPAANFFMGYFYAEALILAEVGAQTGAIQIAATDAFTQLPFFITTCDYTLMGEELYAASAYLSRLPKLLGTIKAQDIAKAVLLAALMLGALLISLGATNIGSRMLDRRITQGIKAIFTAYEKSG